MENGDDWKPVQVHSKGVSDPTANQAAYNVDILGDVLEDLRKRESELESFVGVTLMLINRVGEGLGNDYAMILDQRYIDGLEWKDVRLNGVKVPRSTGKRKVAIAFDWIDSLGLARLERGEFEL